MVGNGDGGKAMIVAAVTAPAVGRGRHGARGPRVAAGVIGGGAGGKDILANAGGKHADRVDEALGGIPARLQELLASAGH